LLKLWNAGFQTWDRPEYQEWALKNSEGYLLVIIRKEKNRFLCVQAQLVMKDDGLPGFEVLEEKYRETEKEAKELINQWKNN